MPLSRIATWHNPPNPAILIRMGTRAIQLSQTALGSLNTEAKLLAMLDSLATLAGITLPVLFAHINDDGTVALATGIEPDIWPEDVVDWETS